MIWQKIHLNFGSHYFDDDLENGNLIEMKKKKYIKKQKQLKLKTTVKEI